MDYRVSCTLTAVVLFIVLASNQSYHLVKKMVKVDDNLSLVLRALVFGAIMYFSCSMV
jgi:hypothetical protein